MSGAGEIAAALRDMLLRIEAPSLDVEALAERLSEAIREAEGVVQSARAALRGNDPDRALYDAMRAAGCAHIAATGSAAMLKALAAEVQAAEASAARMAASYRSVLLRGFAETGAPGVDCGSHIIEPKLGAERIVIPDESRVPPEWLRVRYEPKKAEIAAAKRAWAKECARAARKGLPPPPDPCPWAYFERGPDSIEIKQNEVAAP